MGKISWLAKHMLASQEELYFMGLLSYIVV